MTRIILAGVPEQVNIPICICLEQGIFAKHGIDVEYVIVPEGTGAMLDKLESGEVDVAITVTDGFIAGKASNRKVNLLGTYVRSPLIWAVAAGPQSLLSNMDDIVSMQRTRGSFRIGVSRLGSGSHTMAFYMSKVHGLDISLLNFVIAQNIKGLTAGAQNDDFDVFLWETTTTQPLFDKHELKKIADVSAPWPAFSFVGRDYNNNNNININTSSIASNQEVSNDIISKQNSIRECLFPALAEGISIFVNQAKKVDVDIEVDVEVESKGNDEDLLSVTVERICREFHSTPSQAQSWLDRTIYGAPTMAVDEGIFTTAIATLQEVQLVPTPYVVSELWGNNTVISLLK